VDHVAQRTDVTIDKKEILGMIGTHQLWNLIDYRDRTRKHIFDFQSMRTARRVIFASPDRSRWEEFFPSDQDKGQEPICTMPVWTVVEIEDLPQLCKAQFGCDVTSEDLEHLVAMFGPSPRCCLRQFVEFRQVKAEESVGETKDKATALELVQEKKQIELCNRAFSSDAMVAPVLSKLSTP